VKKKLKTKDKSTWVEERDVPKFMREDRQETLTKAYLALRSKLDDGNVSSEELDLVFAELGLDIENLK
jgi:hypothetical protein